MESRQLLIPPTIKVGFQKRKDTYTGKLAYVIYYDMKGNLRKETSWQSWRDRGIKGKEYSNEPTEGFVLNKGVGGTRYSSGWNTRSEYIRVYDPRDFEFEISVANLLFILRECDCSRGKGLEGQFVYAWDGKELVLLPVSSLDYQQSKSYTDLQKCSIKAKELITGASYITKQEKDLIYLGRFDRYIPISIGGRRPQKEQGLKKIHVFWNGNNFVFLSSMATLSMLKSDQVADNYAELVDQYVKSEYGSKVVELKLVKGKRSDHWFAECDDGSFFQCEFFQCETGYRMWGNKKHRDTQVICINYKHSLGDNGVLKNDSKQYIMYHPTATIKDHVSWLHNGYGPRRISGWIEPTNFSLVAVLESGSEFYVDGPYLSALK